MEKRIEGYDLIRSLAIVVVFFDHALKFSSNEGLSLAIRSLSPGLTMSLLGFISAALLSAREYDFGSFLVKRFTRIYISLIFCLSVILIGHALVGKTVMELSHAGHIMAQHTLLTDPGTSIVVPLLGCIGLLIVAALATAHVLPFSIRGLLFAFYPLAFVPLLFAVSRQLPPPILAASGFFAGLSYEFYILHFYFV